jgi:hypothetical protein
VKFESWRDATVVICMCSVINQLCCDSVITIWDFGTLGLGSEKEHRQKMLRLDN